MNIDNREGDEQRDSGSFAEDVLKSIGPSVDEQREQIEREAYYVKMKSCIIEDIFKMRALLGVFDEKYKHPADQDYGKVFNKYYDLDIEHLEMEQMQLQEVMLRYLVKYKWFRDEIRKDQE